MFRRFAGGWPVVVVFGPGLVTEASSWGQCEAGGGAPGRPLEVAVTTGVATFPAELVGRVLGQDGAPAENAVVSTSAGGQAVTNATGCYRIEVRVPIDVESVRVTAVGRAAGGSTVASTEVTIAGPGTVSLGILALSEGGSCESSWVRTFGGQPGVSNGNWVNALKVFDDGSGTALYAGGSFTSVGGVLASGIAKWDGFSWSALGSGTGPASFEAVYALAGFDDGSGPALFAVGDFETAGGVTANRIAKWDGSSWMNLGAGIDGQVRALTVFDDGGGPALYAAGAFVAAGGVPALNIAKWDGSSWSPLGSGIGRSTVNTLVMALTVFDDGSGPALYAGGLFTSASGVPASGIAKWDGSSWSPVDSGVGGGACQPFFFVGALTVFDDGGGPALYAGGCFAFAGGVHAENIAKWDGSTWSPLGFIAESVSALTVFNDGGGPALYAGGSFITASGSFTNRIAKWNGSSWTTLGSGIGCEGCVVQALAAFDDGPALPFRPRRSPRKSALFAGGRFLDAGGVPVRGIASWNGSSWSALERGADSSMFALAVHDDGGGPALYAGGAVTTVGGAATSRIAKWDGARWFALGSGLDNAVLAVTSFDDGDGPGLYAGGGFTTAGGAAARKVARWDGSTWSALGGGMNDLVTALAVFDDGGGPELIAGGWFTTAGGVSARRIARWDGSRWSALGSGMNGRVEALLVFDDGSGSALYAGGYFTTAGGVAASRIARWRNGTWSPLMGPDSGMNNGVHALVVLDDGSGPVLLAGGHFTAAGGVATNRIARWDGSSWSALGSGMNDLVNALAVFDDGGGPALYAGGYFTTAGGVAANRIARWNGSSWSVLGSGLSGQVEALTVFDDGCGSSLFAGGSFVSAFDSRDSFIAKWQGCLDTIPPMISCPVALLVPDERLSPGEMVNFHVAASDPCRPAPPVTCVPPSGSFFPRGTTIVTCTATDEAGNQASCSFPVVVAMPPRTRPR